MTWLVQICDCAAIFSDVGVAVDEEFLKLSHEKREEILRYGMALRKRALDLDVEYEPYEWWSKASRSIEDFEASLDALERQKMLSAAGRKAKRTHAARRRAQFNAMRSELVLQMLDAGMDYVCAADECNECEDLTVDHIHPLSRGGTDGLSNLQFMCRHHNSVKGDRP